MKQYTSSKEKADKKTNSTDKLPINAKDNNTQNHHWTTKNSPKRSTTCEKKRNNPKYQTKNTITWRVVRLKNNKVKTILNTETMIHINGINIKIETVCMKIEQKPRTLF